MGQPGRPKAALVFASEDEREALYGWSQNPPAGNQSLAQRARIVLACGDGYTNRYVAQHHKVSERMVAKWRRRYLDGGLDGLRDERRSGVPRSITDGQVDAVIEATLEQMPPQGTTWTQASMARAHRISASSVGRIWREHGIDPRRANIVQLSADPAFVGQVRDVLGLYLNPPGGALVLGADGGAPSVAPHPERAERRGADDAGNGPSSLGAALAAAAGRVIADPAIDRETERDRDFRFRQFLLRLDRLAPKDLDIHVIVDHSSTKPTDLLEQWLQGSRRLKLHFVPTYGWWMKLVERWLAELADRGLGRPLPELAGSINDWMETGNEDPRPFVWLKSAQEILDSLATARAPTSGSGHP